MSSVRRFPGTGDLQAQCPSCHAYVTVDEAAWTGQAPLAPHREWRPDLVHLFAEGRPWLLEKRTITARLIWLVLNWANRRVLSTPCGDVTPRDYAARWPTTGLAEFKPKAVA